MRNGYRLAILIPLIVGFAVTAASADYSRDRSADQQSFGISAGPASDEQAFGQDKVALGLYVLDAGANGQPVSNTAVAVRDAEGNEYEETTDSDGFVAFQGQPGVWQFYFAKEGYRTAMMDYNVTVSQIAAVFLQQESQTSLPAQGITSGKDTDLSRSSEQESLQAPAALEETSAPEPVALTVYVHEGSVNGALLPGATIRGTDAEQNSFEAATDSGGSAVIRGVPGTWQFTFAKEGYESASIYYNVTESHEAAAYLQVASTQPEQPTNRDKEQVALTVYVHVGSVNGALLPGATIRGTDAEQNSFEAATDSGGSAVIRGVPGTWQFTFAKEGYESSSIYYNVTETHEAAAYLTPSAE